MNQFLTKTGELFFKNTHTIWIDPLSSKLIDWHKEEQPVVLLTVAVQDDLTAYKDHLYGRYLLVQERLDHRLVIAATASGYHTDLICAGITGDEDRVAVLISEISIPPKGRIYSVSKEGLLSLLDQLGDKYGQY